MVDTIRTEDDLLTNSFQDGQANNAITAQDMRDLVVSARHLQPLGWEFRFDSGNPIGSPLSLANGVPQKVTFTANMGEDLRYPTGDFQLDAFPEIWDNSLQKLVIPTFANGFGIIRLSCLGSSSNANGTHVDFWIDVGSDPVAPGFGGTASNVIYTDSKIFAKGNDIEQAFSWIIPLFGGSDFVTNGAQFLIQSHGGPAVLYNFTLTAAAILTPHPNGEK